MNMNVSLTDELSEFVKSKVSSGRYTSASEVVREALRRLQRAEEEDYLRPPPITAAEARRVYRRNAQWERVERALAGRVKPE